MDYLDYIKRRFIIQVKLRKFGEIEEESGFFTGEVSFLLCLVGKLLQEVGFIDSVFV